MYKVQLDLHRFWNAWMDKNYLLNCEQFKKKKEKERSLKRVIFPLVTYSATNRYRLHVQRQLLMRVEHARGLPISYTAAQVIETVVDNWRANG